jgi:hypothetical protein
MVKRPTSIDRMPPEVRDWIGRLRDQGRTLDEIVAKLRELDLDALPSRSAVYRHLKRAEEVAAKVRESRTVAEAVVRQLGEGEPDRVTRLNIELMHNAVFAVVTRVVDGEPVTLSPMEAMQLAKALDHLGKAAKDDVARTIAIEKRATEKARAEALKQAEATIKNVVKEGGLSAEVISQLRRDFLGVRPKVEEYSDAGET